MKNITKAFVVLLVISIVFVTYKSFYLEGFDTVPSCGNSSESSGAPGCYSTVREDYNGFADVMKSDYILKTQIVTPVCPNSPYTNWNDDLDEKALQDEKPLKDNKNLRDISYNFPNQITNFNYFNQENNDSKSNDSNSKDSNSKDSNSKDSNSKDSNSNYNPEPITKPSNQAEYKEDSPLLNNQPISDSNLSIPKINAPAEPASSDDKKSQPSKLDTCPPCPACKRCPEPVVECKKIVNYKQAGSDRLPVPLIADFSKF